MGVHPCRLPTAWETDRTLAAVCLSELPFHGAWAEWKPTRTGIPLRMGGRVEHVSGSHTRLKELLRHKSNRVAVPLNMGVGSHVGLNELPFHCTSAAWESKRCPPTARGGRGSRTDLNELPLHGAGLKQLWGFLEVEPWAFEVAHRGTSAEANDPPAPHKESRLLRMASTHLNRKGMPHPPWRTSIVVYEAVGPGGIRATCSDRTAFQWRPARVPYWQPLCCIWNPQ